MEIIESFFNTVWIMNLIFGLSFIVLIIGFFPIRKQFEREVSSEELQYWRNKFKQDSEPK